MAVGQTAVKVQLDRSETTIIGGSNGAGKTTLLEALVYNLFGTPYRKSLKIDQLINSVNRKQLETKLNFSIGTDDYTVTRNLKPKKFEIHKNGILIEQPGNAKHYQSILEKIISMDLRIFSQTVVLNKSKYVPFLILDTADRRSVIDKLLDIEIFSEMSTLNKLALKELSSKVSDLESTKAKSQLIIDKNLSFIADNEQKAQNNNSEIEKQISEQQTLQVELEEKKSSCQSNINEVKLLIEGLLPLEREKTELINNGKNIVAQIKSLEQKIAKQPTSCPTCKQDLDQKKVQAVLDTYATEKSELRNSLNQISSRSKEVIEEIATFDDNISTLRGYETELSELSKSGIQIATKINSLKSTIVPPVSLSENEKYALENSKLQTELNEIGKKFDALKVEERNHDLATILLKDTGLKSVVLEKYIPFLNDRINYYLNLIGFNVAIVLDRNFSEKFLSLSRENFSYNNLSDGQKARVDIAILLSFLEVSSKKNSVNTNLLLLDEILEPLDSEGVELFMDMIDDSLVNKNLFVITQRFEEFRDYFKSELKFKQNSGFTELV